MRNRIRLAPANLSNEWIYFYSRIGCWVCLIIFGCLFSTQNVLAQNPIIDSIDFVPTTCNEDNGQITINARGTGLLEYSIDDGDSFGIENVFTDLPKGDYLIVVRDVIGLSDRESIQLPNDDNPDPPTIECPLPLIVECNSNELRDSVDNWLERTIAFDSRLESLDVNLEISLDTVTFECGTILQTNLFAVDDCGQETSCVANIEAIDSEQPSIICPPRITLDIADSSWAESADLWLEDAIVTDNCSSVFNVENNFDIQDVLQTCEEDFEVLVQFTTMDDCSNLSDCTSTLFVLNELSPTVFCDAPMDFECGTDPEELFDVLLFRFEDLFAFDEDITVEDDLNYEDVIGLSCGDQVTLAFTVVDACERMTQCTSDITIVDSQNPVVEFCPPNLTILDPIDARLEIEGWLSAFTSSDNCSAVNLTNDFDTLIYSNLCTQTEPIPVNFFVSDNCGNLNNCSSILTLVPPVIAISCPSQLDLECGMANNSDDITTWLGDIIATINNNDVSGMVSNDFVDNSPFISCDTLINVTFSLSNQCDNPQSCMSLLRITDTTAPDITCPDDIGIITNSNNKISDIEQWLMSASASDNCSVATITNDFDSLAFNAISDQEGSFEVNFLARDFCGNINDNCTRSINLTTQALVITCPPSLMLECGIDNIAESVTTWLVSATASINTADVSNMITDDYDGAALTESCNAILDVTFRISDQFDNTEECTSRINITDTTNPVVTCLATLDILTSSDNIPNIISDWMSAISVTDNCDMIQPDIPVIDVENLVCDNMESFVISATDECGNMSSCTSVISLIDDTENEIDCPEQITFICGSNIINDIQTELNLVAMQNDTLSIVNDFDPSSISLNCDDEQSTLVTYSGTNLCNTAISCTTLLDIIPTQEIYIPNSISLLSENTDDRFFTAYGNEASFSIRMMTIYDRWGGIIWQSDTVSLNEAESGWDARNVGNGVYLYLMDVLDFNGDTQIYSGSITVIK